jgi:N6-adenosine-specific RNA methylase IME4
MEGEAFDELVADIQAHGVREPVWLYERQILDGRNRHRAAVIAGVDCPVREYTGDDPVAFVVSLNLKRRHLNESQRAMVAARLATLAMGANQHSEGTSIEGASSLLNVGRASVERAKMVQRDGAPELVDVVQHGKVSVYAAADVASLPQDRQREIVACGQREILEAAKAIRAEKVEQRRAAKIAETDRIRENNAALPQSERKYSAILVDPPWSFQTWSGAGVERSAENHYPTMSQAEIEALPVGALAADDCALFLWVVMPQLQQGLDVIKAWGFEYKTCAFAWIKTIDGERFATGMGYWTRANAELCLLATKGNPPRLNADVHQIIFAPRMEHSRKPDEAAERIMRLVPGPYIELFARRPRAGWDVWGNEVSARDLAEGCHGY